MEQAALMGPMDNPGMNGPGLTGCLNDFGSRQGLPGHRAGTVPVMIGRTEESALAGIAHDARNLVTALGLCAELNGLHFLSVQERRDSSEQYAAAQTLRKFGHLDLRTLIAGRRRWPDHNVLNQGLCAGDEDEVG